MRQIIVIGAGASGLMSAFHAKNENTSVTILEAGEKPGRKLLATGNGRCNLTYAADIPPIPYRGERPAFADEVLKQFAQPETLQFFQGLGMLMHEKNGGIYPYTDQAQTVLQVLSEAVQAKGVKVKTRERVTQIIVNDTGKNHTEDSAGRFLVKTEGWQYEADAVILACGSKAAPMLGAAEDGYLLSEMLGHRITRLIPSLVPVKTGEKRFYTLAGLRNRAKLSLRIDGQEVLREQGELQWTSYGISGIVVFQMSRFAAAGLLEGKKVQVVADLLPDQDINAVLSMLKSQGKKRADRLFAGVFPQKLTTALLESCKYKASAVLSEQQIENVLAHAKELTLTVTGTKDFESAQVCAGGVDTDEVDSRTLESKKVPGIYFAGELLDVDGACGGYNLQWAWSSGYTAGRHAAEKGNEKCSEYSSLK